MNIKISKDELFNYFIYEFIFYYFFIKLLKTQTEREHTRLLQPQSCKKYIEVVLP